MVTVGANMVDSDIPFWEGQFLGAMSILRRVIDDPRIFVDSATVAEVQESTLSGQIIIFHQPGFHWNKGISLS